LIDASQPSNLNYLWNFGSLLACCLVIQIATGVTLAMHYNSSISEAFNSIEHIMRDVNNGWLIRYLHANTASAFFFLVYLHIGKGMYYGSYKKPRSIVWLIGTILLVLMIGTAFLGYVLPYGQMSLWGATVITNLMSAIPWLGQEIVEFIWGGLNTAEPYCGDTILKILLNAGKSSNIEVIYVIILILFVKIITTWRQSAGVKSISTWKASQRLHAGDLIYAYLIGLFEGVGYFSIERYGKYINYELGIEVSIRDVQLIYKIKNILGIGLIRFREKNSIKMVALIIRDKNHIKKFIIPIFDKYPLFSNKQYDYLKFKECINSDIIYYEDLPEYKKYNNPISHINTILKSSYFSAWLVGFIEAEGSFIIYKPEETNYNKVVSFDISQTNDGYILIYAIKEYLSLSATIYIDETNNYRLKISSVRSIENIIKFLQNSPIKLIGYKRLQYLLWIKELRKIERYSNKITIPIKY
jgi:hypothetical protein